MHVCTCREIVLGEQGARRYLAMAVCNFLLARCSVELPVVDGGVQMRGILDLFSDPKQFAEGG